ncbi:hypothetical protein BBK36DRAFT_1190502 [Trichoderma citrinoviride]|uniref:Uncharacterized protein n=1 Tax=Trichoderma citrinoviride TaxID=58853 RepID=A0A2T4AXM5_9HYPO|nr:hypothetical protein BBK36DRAFT_1190502 [Trichoderma citrinoviride]PTB61728.1 hypothetical protein BBK36DRAFT_1190502 [Trichoderma citrinoviride]
MAQTFMRDDELCKQYAKFAADLDRWHFKIIYWFMFVLNLVILFVASWAYIRSQDTNEQFSHEPRRRTRMLVRYMLMCLACVLVSAAVVVMEAFALLALQFCDGENLISLYWSTWTMIQVGSLIAMMGIILAMAHSLRNRRHPPWALALGTPVLVIAGLLHLIHDCTKKRVKRMATGSIMKSNAPSMSEVNTIQGNLEDELDNTILGDFIGFTVEGGPIVRFNNSMPLNLNTDYGFELLGYYDNTRPVVAYQKGAVQFLSTDKDKPLPPKEARIKQGKSAEKLQESRENEISSA